MKRALTACAVIGAALAVAPFSLHAHAAQYTLTLQQTIALYGSDFEGTIHDILIKCSHAGKRNRKAKCNVRVVRIVRRLKAILNRRQKVAAIDNIRGIWTSIVITT